MAVEFRNIVCGGVDKIYDYCMSLSKQARDMAEKKWPGVQCIRNHDGSLDNTMISIYAPQEVSAAFAGHDKSQKGALVKFIARTTIKKLKVHVQLFFFNEKLAFRLSAQIYNELSDYEYALGSFRFAIEEYTNNHNLPEIAASKM